MYTLELDKVLTKIKENNYKRVLLQFPDGLKPKAKDVVDTIRKETGAEAFIWFGSCYGACDVPKGLQPLKIDLVVQWGHNFFNKEEGW
jgi:2-(3-amino-3-carboxypropyl)histidine synthase